MNKCSAYSLLSGILLFLSVSQLIFAQDSVSVKKSDFGFRSAGITVGWYNPSMDYWNKEYFADTTRPWGTTFKGSYVYTGFIELNIIKNLRVKASGTYWTEKVSSGEIKIGDVKGTEELTSSLTFLSLDLIYRLKVLSFSKFYPYAGLGGSFVLVQNKLVRNPKDNDQEVYTKQGQDYSGTVIAGLEWAFAKHVSAAIDLRYILGSYTQEMVDQTTHKVSISGFQAGISLYYVLK